MYVVRSMTTTDYAPQYGQYPKPFHIYLMPAHKRGRAYWSSIYDAATFATPQEAEAEIVRAGLKSWNLKDPDNKSQVVPLDARHVPDYWDIQQMNRDAGIQA